jgi:hypothetical protein
MSPEEIMMIDLDQIEKFEHLSFTQWIALGNKLGGLNAVKAVLRGTSAVTVSVIRHLTNPVPCIVPASTRNLVDFYQTGPGLWQSLNFKNRILKGVTAGQIKIPKVTLNHSDFVQAANDAEICNDMPVGYVFKDRDLFMGYLASLISAQSGGSVGPLLHTDFKATIFHVEFEPGVPFAVFVDWRSGGSQWYCCADPHVSVRWRAGSRVFGNCA